MKKRSILLLSGLLAISAAGMATASAFIIDNAAKVTAQGTVDSVLVLGWNTSGVTNVSGLTPETMVYKEIKLDAPVASTGQTAYFHMSMTAKPNKSIKGLKVEVATSTWAVQNAPEAIATLEDTGNVSDILTYETAVSDVVTYYLRISIDATEFATYVAEEVCSFEGQISFAYNNIASGGQA